MDEQRSALKPTGLSAAAVGRLAEGIAGRFSEGIPDVRAVVAVLGGRISNVDFYLQSTGDASLIVESDGRFEVRIPWHTLGQRDTFTIAHELGHLMLHVWYPRLEVRPGQRLVISRYGSGPAEYEANWFASSFLMPADLMRREFKNCGGDLYRLARLFNVTEQIVRSRVQGLALAV